jgi:hypothetical protein
MLPTCIGHSVVSANKKAESITESFRTEVLMRALSWLDAGGRRARTPGGRALELEKIVKLGAFLVETSARAGAGRSV